MPIASIFGCHSLVAALVAETVCGGLLSAVMNFLIIVRLEHLESENPAEHDGDRDQHDHHAFDHYCAPLLRAASASLAAWTTCRLGAERIGHHVVRFHQPPPSAWNKAAVSA